MVPSTGHLVLGSPDLQEVPAGGCIHQRCGQLHRWPLDAAAAAPVTASSFLS